MCCRLLSPQKQNTKYEIINISLKRRKRLCNNFSQNSVRLRLTSFLLASSMNYADSENLLYRGCYSLKSSEDPSSIHSIPHKTTKQSLVSDQFSCICLTMCDFADISSKPFCTVCFVWSLRLNICLAIIEARLIKFLENIWFPRYYAIYFISYLLIYWVI